MMCSDCSQNKYLGGVVNWQISDQGVPGSNLVGTLGCVLEQCTLSSLLSTGYRQGKRHSMTINGLLGRKKNKPTNNNAYLFFIKNLGCFPPPPPPSIIDWLQKVKKEQFQFVSKS